jgi:hypothetical protein
MYLPRLPSAVYRLPLTACMAFIDHSAWAAPPVAVRDRAADMITLVGGSPILGMFAGAPTEGTVSFYVAREWVGKHQPALYRKLVAGEDERRREALNQYLQRLTAWRDRRTEPKLLQDFLLRSVHDVEARLRAIADDKPKPEPSQLLIVEVPAGQVRRHYAQTQEVRRLLALAWEARLAGAEELSATAVAAELKKRQIDVEHAAPDLSDRFDVVPLTERQWSAKVALVEFAILGQPHFQGTGGLLVLDEGDGGHPPLAGLVSGMLQDQLGDALGDLLNPQPPAARAGGASKQQAASDKALATAAERKATGVRITYLDQDLQNRRVTVTDTFYARQADGGWQAIWRQSSTVGTDAAKQPGQAELAADPQVAELLTTLKGLGLDTNQDLLKSALSFGGATQQALQSTERDFADFLLSQTRRLIGPPPPEQIDLTARGPTGSR